MLNHAEHWRGSQGLAVVLATVSTILFALLFWVWERDLLWMLAVILPPIWSPVIYRRFVEEEPRRVNRIAVGGVVVGLALVLGVGLLAYVTG